MDIDSGAKAVIETYFNAFDKYVVSLGERFAAYEKHSVENEKLWAKRDEPANGIADTEKFQGWMAEVNREVASMRRMYDEETIYATLTSMRFHRCRPNRTKSLNRCRPETFTICL